MATSPPLPHQQPGQHSQRYHRVSPSFADSAIEVELGESGGTDGLVPGPSQAEAQTSSDELEIRLARIAHFAAAQNSFCMLDEDGRAEVERYLERLEEQLIDPRPQIARAIIKDRPVRSTSISSPATVAEAGSTIPTAKPRTFHPHNDNGIAAESALKQMSRDLTALFQELSIVNAELQQRRIEATHIHDLFTTKCEGMAQRIIEMDHEIQELQADIVEDTIELEGLRGTVRGLESWIGRWQRQREVVNNASASPFSSSSSSSAHSRSRWKPKKQHAAKESGDENDLETLLDGISAWMRGWNDIEEGFRVRAQRRKLRRERQRNPNQP